MLVNAKRIFISTVAVVQELETTRGEIMGV